MEPRSKGSERVSFETRSNGDAPRSRERPRNAMVLHCFESQRRHIAWKRMAKQRQGGE